MFLPVLLIRDYGPLAFLVFALPNILGAALMGRVLSAEGSARFAAAHRPALTAFSFITRAYQWFFAAALLTAALRIPAPPSAPSSLSPAFRALLLLGALVIALLAARPSRSASRAGPIALLFWLASFALLIAFFALTPADPAAWLSVLPLRGASPLDWLGLTLVCASGFGLCPYLDATFHRARQALPARPGMLAFFLGFGLLFALMILATAAYTPSSLAASTLTLVPFAVGLVPVHIMLQLGYTIEVHRQSAVASPVLSTSSPALFLTLAAALSGIALGVLAILLDSAAFRPSLAADLWPQVSAFEIVYRLFLGSYGLVFPAYVFICALPRRTAAGPRVFAPPARAHLITWLVATALAAPCFAAAFLYFHEWLLLPGLALIIAARFAVPAPALR